MAKFKSDFLNVLDQRELIHQISDPEGLDALALKGPITGYVGYDATATSLHIGNLITGTLLYWLQQTGHRPIALMGGGTSMVGDPSFKDEQRKILSVEEIATNIEGIKRIFARILSFGDGPNDAIMVNNADWLLKLNYVEFLRDVGRFFSVNRMLSFDSVKLRLDREQSLSFLEFNYMIMQGYDFVELNRRCGTVLQMGGSDQWGNIINGVDLSHPHGRTRSFTGLTTPLLGRQPPVRRWARPSRAPSGSTRTSSAPMISGSISATRKTPTSRHSLKIFTRLPLERDRPIGGARRARRARTTPRKCLPRRRPRDRARPPGGRAAPRVTARATFEAGAIDLSLPTADIGKAELTVRTRYPVGAGKGRPRRLQRREARRHIQSGAVRINDIVAADDRAALGDGNVLPEGVIKLSVGRKKHALLRPV